MADLELRADYDHDGRLTGSPTEYDARSTAPGALVVVNNDADRRRLPDTVTAGSPVTLDFQQPTPSASDDEMLPVEVRIINPAAVAGSQLWLRVADASSSPRAILAVRTSLFDDRGNILITPDFTKPGEHPLPIFSGKLRLLLELRACPGSPFAHPMVFSTAFTPDNVDEVSFQVQLLGRDAAGKERIFDSGNFSAAPVFFLDNGTGATRLYICDTPNTQAALADLRAAWAGLGGGVQLVTVPESVCGPDTWLQDQFQPGIIFGGDRWRHAIIHLPRMRSNFVGTQAAANLAAFVASHFPAHDVGLMDDFWNRELSFSDATGHQIKLPFRDCIRLSSLMNRLVSLVRVMDINASSFDPNAPPHSGSWPKLRQQLPQIVADFASRAEKAKRDDAAEWNAVLDALVRDARARMGQIQSLFPAGTTPEAFAFTVGNLSFEAGGDLADRLFRRVQQLAGSANYGGNIEAAPPGPGSPFGTIVVGSALINDEDDHMDPDMLRFLYKQKQPVMEVDSTWLDVGHVDEMLTFVPDARGSGTNFAALRASSGLAMKILRAAARRYRAGLPSGHPHTILDLMPSGVLQRLTNSGTAPVTRLLRGKLWLHIHPTPSSPGDVPDILEPPHIYQRLSQAMNFGDPRIATSGGINIYDIHYWPGPGQDRVYPADITILELLFLDRDANEESVNDFIEEKFLAPLDTQLVDRFKGLRAFPLPVLFDRVPRVDRWRENQWAFSTSAFSPDVVNLQVINRHLLMPRPYGPRMKPDDARAVLSAVFQDLPNADSLRSQLTPSFFQQARLRTTVTWIQRHEQIVRPISSIGPITVVFNGLTTLRHVARAFQDGFPGPKEDQIMAKIQADNASQFTPTGELKEGWRKLIIHENMVDLFEACILAVAGALGLQVDFVDTWFYHLNFGGLHCGTNVLRAPQPGQRFDWWRTVQSPGGGE